MLSASAITMPGSDNIPFYASPSGHLILANTTVERVNGGLVFKQAPMAAFAAPCATSDQQEPYEHPRYDEASGPEVTTNDEQKLLSQKVKKLMSKASKSDLPANTSVIVNGYDLTKLATLADRLKHFRTLKSLSQAKLSRRIAETTAGGLKFSQTFLCRYFLCDYMPFSFTHPLR
uniref:POU-specific domain-containing protein n=1 Tax=Mesocestoides corti TaxID=53468 RepID=A0A5K3G1P3_MESCO